MSKPVASLSLDLDNKWSYLKTHGDRGWESFPTYLDLVVPRILELLSGHGLRITVFIVGQDAVLDKNHDAIASIAAAGHEIGNHSFRHEPWLHLYSREDLEAELVAAEEAIERVTGQRPVGFRGPGFSYSDETMHVLARRGYEYDASTLPTFLGPMARAYYFLTAKLDDHQKEQRKVLFGKFSEGFRPLRPHAWELESQQLVEIPVTTMPLTRLPIHVSYLLYLAQFSYSLALTYFRLALALCRIQRIGPSLLLHPLDFLGGDDEQDLSFFPAMRSPGAKKVEQVAEVLRIFSDQYQVVTMREHCHDFLRGRHRSGRLAAPDVDAAVEKMP